MSLSTLIAQYRDRIERRWGERLRPDYASEWEEKIASVKEAPSGRPVRGSALGREATRAWRKAEAPSCAD